MTLGLGGGYVLRQARSDDHAAMNRICLLTGDSGKDATTKEDDPDLLGLIYAVPYQVFAPRYAFVIDGPNGVCGYALGVVESDAFYRWAGTEWFPQIAHRHPDPGPDESQWRGSDWARYWVHHPEFPYFESLHSYPAHGHLDLLEEVQGRGFGRRALQHVMECLAADGALGMHLGVNPSNEGAMSFYAKLGFTPLACEVSPRRPVFMVKGFGGRQAAAGRP